MNNIEHFRNKQNVENSLNDTILETQVNVYPKIKVIYFSPTGTTKKIIENIIKGILPEKVDDIDLTKSNRVLKKETINTEEDDLIILGSPVYGGFLYKEFRNYIKRIDFNGKPVAITLLYGNASILFAKREVLSLVKENNGKVVGYGDFVGEHSFSTIKIPVAINRPNRRDRTIAILFGKALRNKLNKKDIVQDNQHISLLDKFISQIADKKPIHTGKRFFTVPQTKQEHCNHCGICIKKCPKACIDYDFQTNKDECIVCMACVKACPYNARITKAKNPLIKYGLKIINKNKKESHFILF